MFNQLTVCLDNLRSAYNVGTIFRTADAARVDHLMLTGFTPLPPSPKLDKTALGSLTTVPWTHHCCVEQYLATIKKSQHLVACEITPRAKSLFTYRFPPYTCLVFGNEVTGIQFKAVEMAHDVVSIPQYGLKESLNVAVAAGIFIYEFRRQYPLY